MVLVGIEVFELVRVSSDLSWRGAVWLVWVIERWFGSGVGGLIVSGVLQPGSGSTNPRPPPPPPHAARCAPPPRARAPPPQALGRPGVGGALRRASALAACMRFLATAPAPAPLVSRVVPA